MMNEAVSLWLVAFSTSLIGLFLFCFRRRLYKVIGGSLYVGGALIILLQQASGMEVWSPGGVNQSALLLWLIALPLLSGSCFALLSIFTRQGTNRLSGVVLAIQVLLALGLFEAPVSNQWKFQWISQGFVPLGMRWHWAVDGLNFYFILLIVGTMPLLWAAQLSLKKAKGEVPGCLLLVFQGALLSAFLAVDLGVQFLSLDLVLLILFLMAVNRPTKNAIDFRYLIFALFGSLLRWCSLSGLLYFQQQLSGVYSSDLVVLTHLVPSESFSWWCYGALSISFLMLIPVFPLQHWLEPFRRSPTLTFLVTGLLSAFGLYAYIRVCMGLMPGPAGQMSAFLATATLVFGAFYGLTLLRRAKTFGDWISLAAFISAGIGLLGVFASNEASLSGALLVFMSRGISLAALCLLYIYTSSRGVDLGLVQLRYLRLPLLFSALAISVGLLCGMPFSLGWVAHFMVVSGTFMAHHGALARFGHLQGILGAIAVLCFLLSAFSLLQRLRSPSRSTDTETLGMKGPLNSGELLYLVLLILCSFGLGSFPQAMLSRISPATSSHLNRFIEGRREFAQQEGGGSPRLLPLRGDSQEIGYPSALHDDETSEHKGEVTQ